MSKIAQYSANLAIVMPYISRNEKNIQAITAPSFWINDVEQADNSHQIKITTTSQKNWLKITQAQGESCTLFPVDGNEGVFKYPPPVSKPDDFILDGKRMGGCDFLIVKDKWLFAELKTEATSLKLEQIKENRAKAALQLARTLTYFQENTPKNTMTKSNTSCLIVTPTFFPKVSKMALAQTVRFLKDFKVPLLEKTTDEVVLL
jgi:hypothetical protein